MLDKTTRARIAGPALLFGALFLPGYVYQSAEAAARALSEPALLVQNLLLGLTQALLILYIVLTRGHETRENAGIVPFRAADALQILAGIAGLFIITVPSAFLGRGETDRLFSSVAPETTNPGTLLLLALVVLVTGYREELFFRSYLLTELEPFGRPTAIAIGSSLFALGHFYQGFAAVIVTLLIGIFLSWLFFRTRNVHIVALSHGMYNFLVILAATLL